MGRTMALCSLPRTNPGNRLQYKRVNGPYQLYMIAGGGNKLPFGNIPRLLLAWMTTEAVRTQSRELILGSSLSEFMGKLGMDSVGGARTRLRNQMRRLFNAHVQLVYEDKLGEANAVIGTAGSFFTGTEGSLSMQPREQVDTGVDVGSNETAHERTSADPGRPGRGRLRPSRRASRPSPRSWPCRFRPRPRRPPSSPTPVRAPIPMSGKSVPTDISGNFKHSSSGPATMRVAIRSRQFKSG